MRYVALFIVLLLGLESFSQGCSDAGICKFHRGNPYQTKMQSHSLSVSNNTGIGDEKILVSSSNLAYKFKAKDISLSLDAGYSLANGDLGTHSDFSDLTLSIGYQASESFQILVGHKIPLSKSNQKHQGRSLPMAYQASLGTFDLLLGGMYQWDKYAFTLAYQQPLTDNDNAYTSALFSEGKVGELVTTNGFARSADLLFRVSRVFDLKQDYGFDWTTSFLSIYHLEEDTYKNAQGQKLSIANSDGLTLNIVNGISLEVGEQQFLDFRFGFPVKVREIRPDGTTRGISAVLEYGVKF